jgi:hypothetical protein
MEMTIVGEVIANDLLVFMLENPLFDSQDRAIGRNVRPAFASRALVILMEK